MSRISFLLALSAFLGLMSTTTAPADPARNVTCVGCVGSSDILDGGVKHKDIAADAVTAGKIKNGAVNANKLALGAVDWQKLAVDLQERILQLEDRLAAVEAQSSDTQDYLSKNTVLKLDGFLDLDSSDPEKPTARFAGVNLQVVNGLGATESINGLGNLIVGYDELVDEEDFSYLAICSHGSWASQDECRANGEVWAINHRSGSHNLVVGPEHRYSQAAGFLSGRRNAVNRVYANVSGGIRNVASGRYASINGGFSSLASGNTSAIAGGFRNFATGDYSMVSGGARNGASGEVSMVGGGLGNTATNNYALVCGGSHNTASGHFSVVSGGEGNRATFTDSVVSGGWFNVASGSAATVSGGYENTASGGASAVSGGYQQEAKGQFDWAAGELWQDQ